MPIPLPPATALVFSASDPTCGAGLQADILTFASLGIHPLTVLTAITVQDTQGVAHVAPLAPDYLKQQARMLLADIPVSVFKAGVLASVENILSVLAILEDYPDIPFVLDPVLASGRGDLFADQKTRAALRQYLLPRATIITPNALEALDLLEEDKNCPAPFDAEKRLNIAKRLLAFGPRYVLLTGTHLPTKRVINSLYGSSGLICEEEWERLPESYHGSGCTLASAIAAFLACGADLKTAVKKAQAYTWKSLKHGFCPGKGQFIPDRLFNLRRKIPDF